MDDTTSNLDFVNSQVDVEQVRAASKKSLYTTKSSASGITGHTAVTAWTGRTLARQSNTGKGKLMPIASTFKRGQSSKSPSFYHSVKSSISVLRKSFII